MSTLAWRKLNRERINAGNRKSKKNRKALGKCSQCAELSVKGRTLCEFHLVKVILRHATGRAASSVEVLRMINKFADQRGRCPYTGLEIRLGDRSCHLDHKLPVSRFPEQAGNIENLEWVSADVNLAKGVFTQTEFISFCKMIVEHCAGGIRP